MSRREDTPTSNEVCWTSPGTGLNIGRKNIGPGRSRELLKFTTKVEKSACDYQGGRRYPPNVFTEHGVFNALKCFEQRPRNSVNIQIMRIYPKLREMLMTNRDIF